MLRTPKDAKVPQTLSNNGDVSRFVGPRWPWSEHCTQTEETPPNGVLSLAVSVRRRPEKPAKRGDKRYIRDASGTNEQTVAILLNHSVTLTTIDATGFCGRSKQNDSTKRTIISGFVVLAHSKPGDQQATLRKRHYCSSLYWKRLIRFKCFSGICAINTRNIGINTNVMMVLGLKSGKMTQHWLRLHEVDSALRY